ncbi:MAG TPA: HPr family phosphocarrier protein [Polyangia bacterium]|nr:HPr family phosphocarrier protein [Polyangia bacterium]
MTSPSAPAAQAMLEIKNELGMHARAATKFVQLANRFKSDVSIEKDGQEVNGKSIMGVLMLAAAKGTRILVKCQGEDAGAALAALSQLVDVEQFGEP